MTASQLPLQAPAHRNQQLFSDHYLDHLLPRHPEWQALAAEAAPVLQRIAAIARGFNTAANEAQLEEDLARPILRELGHSFEVQAALQTPLGTKRPDYVFFRDEAARQAQRGTTLTDEALRRGGIAVGDAKAWDRPLDVAARKGNADQVNANPSYQIAFYIQHSGLSWGILTNGRLWRLYQRDTAHKLDRFYEVDLFDLLGRNDPQAFLYFYAFFRRAAFDAGPLGLDTLLAASQEYARAVGNTLKAQVYDALLHLAQGFLDHPANGLQPDPAMLAQIYDNSLIVLYRLLFILYAEARELLPLRESQPYRDEYSLNAIKRKVAQDREYGRALLPTSTRYWSQLRDLFGMIDRGSPPLRIAAFNGGLFDPQRHAFLERYSIGDARLQHAIDLLARVNKEFVDYRDLAERHLGTIYEGLLEYHLEPLATRAGQDFTIQLLNDKGERKATGSYYTPDYIVKYIVDQTVGPVLRRAVAGKNDDAAIIRAVLAINVLDPAMGSGHFLVEATDYIASFLVDLGVQPDEDNAGEADVAFWKRRVAQSCIYGVDLNPLAVDLAKLSLWLATVAKDRPLSFLDHHLRCGNALVGARLDALTLARSRHPSPAPGRGAGGEGKRGPRKPKVQPEAQLALFDEEALRQTMSRAVDSMWLIEASAAHSVADVKEQEQAYQSVRADLNAKYGRLADLVTATHFGLQVDQTLWNPLADYATGRSIAAHQRIVDWLHEAERIAQARRFFHWELEFPEVFFDRHGQPLGDAAGFDAVVGNPPYVRQEQLAPYKPYFQQHFAETYNGVADLYVYFYQQGLQQTQHGGRLAYIVTNKWLRAGYGEGLRAYFATHSVVEQIIDFGHAPIFEGADVFPCIIVVEKPSESFPHPPAPAPRAGAGEQRSAGSEVSLSQSPAPRAGAGEQRSAGDAVSPDRWEVPEAVRRAMGEVARQFRKEPTRSEDTLWQALRGKKLDGRKFRRQQAIGSFIVDFFCPADRLIVEVDGAIHDQQRAADQQRQQLLESLGLRFVRVAADDVEHDLESVLERIRAAFRPLPHPPAPAPRAGEGETKEQSRSEGEVPLTSFPSPHLGEGVARSAGGEGTKEGHTVQVTTFPREALKLVQLDSYVRRYSHRVPQRRLGRAPWSLEEPDVDDLMEKIKRVGVPLAEFAGVKPYYGIKTGFNEAFLIDTPTKERLIREDPRSAEIIKPYLRGQDIKRWSPEWDGMWIVLLKSSGDYHWPWSQESDEAESVFQKVFPALYNHMKPLESKLRARQDKGRYWWELRACAYYDAFAQAKIMYQVIQFHPQYGNETKGAFTNDKGFFLPVRNLWLLAVLNAPLMWWHNWRYLPHMKDEALNPAGVLMEKLPIAPPTDAMRAEAEPAVARLIAITQANQEARRDTLDWLHTEFEIDKPGQKLEAFASLDESAFIEEARKRRPKAAGKLSPAALKALRAGYTEQAVPVQQRQIEAQRLERRLSDLVNQAYDLTPEEIETMWRTAPPRMPVPKPS